MQRRPPAALITSSKAFTLIIVAVLLTPSGAPNGVTEAFGVHEMGQQPSSTVLTLDSLDGRDYFAAEANYTASSSANVGAGVLGNGTANVFPWTIPASLGSVTPGPSGFGVPGFGSASGGRSGTGLSASVSAAPSTLSVSVARVDASLLPRMTGIPLLNQLALLPRGELARFVSDNPASIKQLIGDQPVAGASAAWWAGMPSASKKSLLSAAPELVGNLEGIPFRSRDDANRRQLSRSIAEVKGSMSQLGRGEVVAARLHLHMLEQVREAVGSAAAKHPKSLLTFDSAGQGRAAIVVGNLAKADYVSYLVPGMFFSVDAALGTWTDIATDLNREQGQWLNRLADADPSMAGKSAATVAWIGYQTPGITQIASLSLAQEGADLIGRAVDGVQAVRSGSEPFVTVIGHSYGSTAAMIELAKGGVHVDALALIGSPGSAAQTASDLSVRNNNVYVGEAAWDPVVNSAFYGSDPGSGAFGATKMSVAGGVDPITHRALTASAGHLGYFEPGSESMRNLALIGLNQGSLVTRGTTLDASRTLGSNVSN
ncbi:MAG: alpha/beta hydrolase [Lacisediminihabitans sp.]